KMAERAATGGGTSLRGMRERMVAAANAIAQERRNQSGFSSLPPQSSNTRSVCKPVLDGSVLKNDIKQKLAKERREEKRRQQDATKEIQLLEKERKSKIQYEKQMEEKQRKLREQKQKDEQRRLSVEEKRKQKLQEEREKFKAVVSRTLERSNRIEQRQKRWSWEGSMTVNSESKTEETGTNFITLFYPVYSKSYTVKLAVSIKKRSVSTEKLEQDTSGSHKQVTLSSPGVQNSVAKIQQLYTNLWENDLIMRLIAPTKASLARSKSAASLSIPGKDTPVNIHLIRKSATDIHSPVVRSTNMPLLSHSSDELKNTMVLCKSTVAVPFQEKVETFLRKSNLVNKKRTSTHTPLSKWPSSASVWGSPSPINVKQIQKNCPPSVSPVVSKQSEQSSVPCKIIPVKHTQHTQKVLGTIRRKKKRSSKKTTKSSEAMNQKHMTYDVESGNKSTQGIMNAEEATKILSAKRRLAREHKEKEEKLQKQMEQRKEKDVTKKVFEGQERFSKFDHGQQQKAVKKKKGRQPRESQRVLLQLTSHIAISHSQPPLAKSKNKGDAEIKAKEEADKFKKEQEKIMLQNLQERLERIEEIMKRTRKTD
uniref:MAP7 domain containing 3 n=1 Tax=Myotis lucifugus TaxID=59463 RepID=G1QCK8_MYOLU